VFRAEEHLSNTLRQLILYAAFSYAPPQFGHLSLILGPDRQKLSKRHGATSCNEYREAGFLPEALNNFIALLGWSSPTGEEILSLDAMIEQFGVERLNPAPAVFDDVKVKWMNATHLRALPHGKIWELITPFLEAENLQFLTTPEWIERSVALLKTSMETLKDAVELYRPLAANQFKIYDESSEVLSWEPVPAVIKEWISLLKASDTFLSTDDFLAAQEKIKVATGAKGKFLFMPIRVAIIGKPHGAELKDLVPLIARDVLVQRAEQCLIKVNSKVNSIEQG
jgi:nondiscriminating glutamyl-tRNA synthetase